jgi:hypothetical protein
MTPAMHHPTRSINARLKIIMSAALAPSPQPRPALTGQTLPPCRVESKEVRKWLDNKPQLKGRFTPKLHLRHRLDPIGLYVRHVSAHRQLGHSAGAAMDRPGSDDATLRKFADYRQMW